MSAKASPKVQAELLQSELRCASCRERIDGRVYRCPGCHSSLHATCHDQLAVCPALGCAHPFSDAKVLVASKRSLGPWALFAVATAVGVGGLVAARRAAERPPAAPPQPATNAVRYGPLDLLAVGRVLAHDGNAGRRRAAAAALAQDLERFGFSSRRRDVLRLRVTLVNALVDPDLFVRLHVTRCLAQYGRWLWIPAKQRPALLRACIDPDVRVRRVAVACLAAATPPRAQPSDDVVSALIARLKDDDLRVQAAAIDVIAHVSDEAVSKPETARAHPTLFEAGIPALVQASKHPRLWTQAVRALARLAQHASLDDVQAERTPLRGVQVARLRNHEGLLVPLAQAALDDVRTRTDGVKLLQRLSIPPERAEPVNAALTLAWHADPRLRSRITTLLGHLGGAGVPLLLSAFVASTPEGLQRHVAAALARTGTTAGRKAILTALSDPRLRPAAAVGLRSLPALTRDDLPALAPGLDAPSVPTRDAVVRAIGRIDAPESIPLLARAVGDAHQGVCMDALHRLASFPPALLAPALPALEAAVADPFANVRARAVSLLFNIRQARPALPRASLLADLRSADTSRRRRAAWQIAPGPEVVPALLKALDRRDPITACLILRAFPHVRAQAEVVPAVSGFLAPKTSAALQEAALIALTGLREHALDALPIVIGLLKRSQDPSLLKHACTLVGRIGPAATAARPAVEALLKHADEGVVGAAQWALKRLQP